MTAGWVCASPIYHQDFVGTETGNRPLTLVNWNSQYGTNAITFTGTGGETGAQRGGSGGFWFLYFLGSELDPGTPFLGWTDDGDFGTFDGITEVSMSMHFGNNADPLRFVMEVDGSWYASEGTFYGQNYETNSVNIQMTDWRSLSFTPDVVLSLGGPVAAPSGSGNVTAVGVYGTRVASGGVIRLNEFTVIPEPGTFGLFALSMLGIYAVRRYRQR